MINCEAIHPQLINGRGRKVPQHTEGQCYLAMSLVCISCIVYELQGNKYDKFKDIIDVPVLKRPEKATVNLEKVNTGYSLRLYSYYFQEYIILLLFLVYTETDLYDILLLISLLYLLVVYFFVHHWPRD